MTLPKQRIALLMAFLIAIFALSQTRLVYAKNFLGPVTDGSDVVDTNDGVCTLREAMNAAFNNAQANDDCGSGSISDTDVITFSGVTQVTLDNTHTELPNIDDDNPNGLTCAHCRTASPPTGFRVLPPRAAGRRSDRPAT